MSRESTNTPASLASSVRPWQRTGRKCWLNGRRSRWLAAGFIVAVNLQLPTAAWACGWWGEEENDTNSEAITVDGEGQVKDNAQPSADDPAALTRQANHLRQFGTSGYAGAVRLYRQAAEQGYAPAQNNLAAMYEQGLGVVPDLTEALHWYQRAAEQGESHAQHSLGEMLLAGKGVEQDAAQGIYWIEQAANQNHPSACASMGKLYATGEYLDRDIRQALFWWERAQQLGYPNASQAVNALLSAMAAEGAVNPPKAK